ncbi:MAG: hypothetical protein V1835_01080 [Candidatus Micrarchaeota archaeon]
MDEYDAKQIERRRGTGKAIMMGSIVACTIITLWAVQSGLDFNSKIAIIAGMLLIILVAVFLGKMEMKEGENDGKDGKRHSESEED